MLVAIDTTDSPFFPLIVSGTISRSKNPCALDSATFVWDASANRSWSTRLIRNSCATFSAVCIIESTPNCAFNLSFTNRQPSVVSYIVLLRLNPCSAFGRTNGARLILSTPPAIIISASLHRMVLAALPTASMPEPHKRLIVTPGTEIGKPASKALILATLRLSSPAWFAHPRMTSSKDSQSTDGFVSTMDCNTTAARSSGRTPDNAPA